ncbi:hypothetical protein OH77DRAFT_1416372 [Trametes cingulata]|nr:hypothetical protein OH77DRAFT_1416372 [Trametes cingulata]
MHTYYVLRVSVVRALASALAISLLLNCVIILMQKTQRGGITASRHEVDLARLPLSLRRVALEVVDSDRYGMDDDNDWASVIPLGHGFVRLGKDHEFYAVSMYHQMHCLNSFRRMFNGHRNASRAQHDGAHALHCLTYLRQMVLCSADITLEPAFSTQNVDGRKTKAAYGTGVTHECQDWVQVREFVERNYEEWKDEDHYAVTEVSAIDGV